MEVGAAKAVDEEGGPFEVELRGDVLLDRGGGGRGERDDGCGTKCGKVLAERAIVRPEVMAPGGDAVRFVDRNERWFASCEHLGKPRNPHAFRCDKEKLEVSVEVIAASLAGGLAAEAGVDASHAKAGLLKLRGLIVHEGDER